MQSSPAMPQRNPRVPPLTEAELSSLNKLFQRLGDEAPGVAELGASVLGEQQLQLPRSIAVSKSFSRMGKAIRRSLSGSSNGSKRKISPRRYPGYKRSGGRLSRKHSGTREERAALVKRDALCIGARLALGDAAGVSLKALHAAHDYHDKHLAELELGAQFQLQIDGEPILVTVDTLQRLEIIRAGTRFLSVRMPDSSLILRGAELGRGAVKAAYAAIRAADNELIDLVEVVPYTEDEEGAELLEAELETVAALPNDRCPYFAAAQQAIYGIDGSFLGYIDLAYSAMERRSARNLPERLEIASRYADIAAALSTLHSQGQVYADAKPSNFLERDQHAYLHDFGTLRQKLVERQGLELSTVTYLSPEAHTSNAVSPLSDSWAFGLSLWQQCYGTQTTHQLSDGSTYYEFSYPPFLEQILDDAQLKLAQGLPQLRQADIEQQLFPIEASCDEEILLQEVIRCCLQRCPMARMQLNAAHEQLALLQEVFAEEAAKRKEAVVQALVPVEALKAAMHRSQAAAEMAVQGLFERFGCSLEANGWLRYTAQNHQVACRLLTAGDSREHQALLRASREVQDHYYPELERAAQGVLQSLGRLLGVETTKDSLQHHWESQRDRYSQSQQRQIDLAICQAGTVEQMRSLEAAIARGERPQELHVIPISGMLAGAIKTQEVNVGTQLELLG